ncbi:hypothetical protein F5884DRAFT_731445, partial [Xylogone sp. PMI_703]
MESFHVRYISRTYTVQAKLGDTVNTIAEQIAKQTGIPVAEHRYIYNGKQVRGNRLLSSYNIRPGGTLSLLCWPLPKNDHRAPKDSVPVVAAFPSGDEAFLRIKQWNAV